MWVALVRKVNTDLQEVHVCFDDNVFCMEVERGCGEEDDSRPHLTMGVGVKVPL